MPTPRLVGAVVGVRVNSRLLSKHKSTSSALHVTAIAGATPANPNSTHQVEPEPAYAIRMPHSTLGGLGGAAASVAFGWHSRAGSGSTQSLELGLVHQY